MEQFPETTDTTAPVAGTDSPPAEVTEETPPPVAEQIIETVTAATDDPAVEAIADAVAETAPEPAAAETAQSAPAGSLSRAEILAEVEQIAATPDDVDGKQPDDRKLIDRLKALDALWLASPEPTDADKDLRRRYDTAKKAYAAARARRAELRGVIRARAGETKRGLLVEAFTLARMVDPEKVKVPTPAAPVRREPRRLNRPSPAMFAKRPAPPAAPEPPIEGPVDVPTESSEPATQESPA